MSAVTLLWHFAHLKQSTWKKDWLTSGFHMNIAIQSGNDV